MTDSSVFPTTPEIPEPTAEEEQFCSSSAKAHSYSQIIAGLEQDIPNPPGDDELVKLRELLFAREITLLDRLCAAVGGKRQTAEMVSEVLAEALVLRGSKDHQLNMALGPVVDDILKASLRKRQHEFVNVLFPLMGPSIRKSIAETFRSMLVSFSKSMEMAFSWRGLRWRFQAWRSGKSFSEIVMLNTLVYRVEQIFFIHNDTGLVLSHLANEGVGSHDADMVSAMLTAIQDFVRDCFTSGGEGDLESLQFGEFTIYIEKSSTAYLACVVRGTPPASLRQLLRETLELLLVEFEDQLEAFDGDTAPFSTAPRFLEGCIQSHYIAEDESLPLWAKIFPVLAILLVAGVFGTNYYRNVQLAEQNFRIAEQNSRIAEQAELFRQHMQDSLSILRDEPGLMIIHVNEETRPWEILALKDPLARDPLDVLRENNVATTDFWIKLVPFVSYDASIVVRRAQTDIPLLDTVTMDIDAEGTLYLRGAAPLSWIVQARDMARTIPGVKRVDTNGIHDPKMSRISELVSLIESAVIEFPLGKATPLEHHLDTLQKAVNALVELEHLATGMGFSTTLTIYGHADQVGSEKRNYEISQDRTRTVAAMLYAKGASIPIAMYGMGSEYPAKGNPAATGRENAGDDQGSRRIELRVHLARSASTDTESILQYIPR